LQSRTRLGGDEPFDSLEHAGRAYAQLLGLVEETTRVGGRAGLCGDAPEQEPTCDRERVERRVELGGGELHLPERLADQRELRRQADVVAHGDLRELLQERTEPQLTEVEMPVVADQRLQL